MIAIYLCDVLLENGEKQIRTQHYGFTSYQFKLFANMDGSVLFYRLHFYTGPLSPEQCNHQLIKKGIR